MTDRSSAIATLERWKDAAEVPGRDAVRQLFLDIGYMQEAAVDYRAVWLYYRPGWPRLTIMSTEEQVPVGYLHRICDTLLPLLRSEHTV